MSFSKQAHPQATGPRPTSRPTNRQPAINVARAQSKLVDLSKTSPAKYTGKSC